MVFVISIAGMAILRTRSGTAQQAIPVAGTHPIQGSWFL
jgi:hypothetical protein